MNSTRLVMVSDAPRLAELIRINREFLAPWEPLRDEDHYTVEGQRRIIEDALARHARGDCLPHVILDEYGHAVGRITLNDIVRGPFQSSSLGYWLNAADNGRGLVTTAVREIIAVAFGELGLHRLQAGTLLHNIKSQRVLERTGFVRYGTAPAYLCIAGQWQDHVLYQLIRPEPA